MQGAPDEQAPRAGVEWALNDDVDAKEIAARLAAGTTAETDSGRVGDVLAWLRSDDQ
ncbi:MAG: hypothetical protein AAGA42_08625 [Actinomycetota bacterium]